MLLPSPRTSDTNGAGHHGDGDLRTAVAEIPLLPTPAAQEPGGTADQYRARWAKSDGRDSSFLPLSLLVQSLLPTPRATDGTKGGPNQRGSSGDLMLPSAVATLLPTPTVRDSGASGGSKPCHVTLSDAVVRTDLGRQENPRHAQTPEDRPGEELRSMRGASDSGEVQERATRGSDCVPEAQALLAELRQQSGDRSGEHASMESAPDQATSGLRELRNDGRRTTCPSHRPGCDEQRAGEPDGALRVMPPDASLAGGSARPDGVDYGPYTAAIQRWEAVLGRPAPTPTKLNAKGSPKLSDEFDEFLMGFPAGWITDVPGVTWNETLKACGNGVMPQQGTAAFVWLIGMGAWEAAA